MRKSTLMVTSLVAASALTVAWNTGQQTLNNEILLMPTDNASPAPTDPATTDPGATATAEPTAPATTDPGATTTAEPTEPATDPTSTDPAAPVAPPAPVTATVNRPSWTLIDTMLAGGPPLALVPSWLHRVANASISGGGAMVMELMVEAGS